MKLSHKPQKPNLLRNTESNQHLRVKLQTFTLNKSAQSSTTFAFCFSQIKLINTTTCCLLVCRSWRVFFVSVYKVSSLSHVLSICTELGKGSFIMEEDINLSTFIYGSCYSISSCFIVNSALC